MDTAKLEKEFSIAATKARGKGWAGELGEEFIEDIKQELWYKYLSEPYFRNKVESAGWSDRQAMLMNCAKSVASNMFEGQLLASDRTTYSVDAVKDALKGLPANKELPVLLAEALDLLKGRNAKYFDALHSRYVLGVVPNQGASAQYVTDALAALTDEVNRAQRRLHEPPVKHFDATNGVMSIPGQGVKLRDPVDAERRRRSGDTSDPTANTYFVLEGDPEAKEAFYGSDEYPITHATITESSPDAAWNIFDHELQGMPELDNYRASVFPELYPHEKARYVAKEA